MPFTSSCYRLLGSPSMSLHGLWEMSWVRVCRAGAAHYPQLWDSFLPIFNQPFTVGGEGFPFGSLV